MIHDAEDLCLDLTAREDHLNEIVKALESDNTLTLEFAVFLDSFTRKVDEPFVDSLLKTVGLKPKTCLIEDNAKCLLRGTTITRSLSDS